MNNYYELIYLNRELKEKVTGTFFDVAISPHKDVLECFLRRNSESLRLIFSANPNETALFLDRYRSPKKSNVIEFFKRLEGKKVTDIKLADYDRLLYIFFEEKMFLLFKLYGGNPNVMLVREGQVTEAFKNPAEAEGSPPPEPYAPSFSDEVSTRAKPENQIKRLNPLLPRNLIPKLVDQHRVDSMKPSEVMEFVKMITRELEENPHPRVLVTGETSLWSEEVLNVKTDRSFDTVTNAIRHAYRNRVHTRRLSQKKEEVHRVLDRSLSKQESQLNQLRQADKSLERADEYEKFGHLLMAHAHETISPDLQELEVEDFYEGDDTIRIPLKEQMTIAENAQYYYEKAKDSRRSYEKAKDRVSDVEEHISELQLLLKELKGIEHLPDLEKWIRDRGDVIKKYGYGTGESRQARSPFRKFRVGKYEVWIGKSARSNDELTGRAHKEDIWLHARGVAGSHVVIRMGNQKEYPPRQVILKAASYAAHYSKARGMKSAPVMITKVKYVRKPKGAPPGAMVVDREEVEMVPPMKPVK